MLAGKGEQGAQSRGQAACAHGEGHVERTLANHTERVAADSGVVDTDGRRQPVRAPQDRGGAETRLGPGAHDEPGSLPFLPSEH